MLVAPNFVMPNLDLEAIMRSLLETGKRTHQLWLTPDSLAFVARGREYRSEFHINPSYEVQYSIKGDLNLHYRTPGGEEKVAFVPQGSCLFQPPFVPHSPRFAPDSFQLVIERARLPGEIDRFHWFCPNCDHFLHEEFYTVDDYKADPVSRAYDNFYGSEEFRTCKKCGTVMPVPEQWAAKA
ncbi:MAG TPA: 3-hydroxybutyryl-CoA dehydratase [Eoetvoesiella sp.]|jgi:3-hydroxyanthranilate 3,4-dioxygenase|uniref:3-hydroxyanthranilate 3,4-dioxygenase n=1 Tax=Eoetvoesiella sp. TaxID=1966355 RepID=UPI002C58EBD8|nr:3-hydroxybutyryl-CoA dehydratase [Eoetvoesiella sp.]HWK61235.1 3-hydroxybutyryl-CoA dehydratase [Eoetvoesiella sp.]